MTDIAVDEVLISTGGQGTGTSFNIPKVNATSPTALTIQFTSSIGGPSPAAPPTSVTYGGVPITYSTFSLVSGSPGFDCYYGYILNPPPGILNLTFNYSVSAGFKNIILLATFWTGGISSVNWTTRSTATSTPVVSIAKAATSAISSFVLANLSSGLTFLGDGAERIINPVSTFNHYAATQEPSQGTGAIDWQNFDRDEGLNPVPTSHVSAEIIAGAEVSRVGGHPQLMFGR